MQKRSSVRIPRAAQSDVERYADEWLAACGGLSPRTLSKYSRLTGEFLTYVVAEDCADVADAFTAPVIHGFLNLLRKRRVSESTVDTYARCVRTFAYWLEGQGYLSRNPFALKRITMPRPHRPEIEPFTREQVAALLQALDNFSEHGVRNRAIILLMLDTGIRAAELVDLSLTDYDPKRLRIRIRHGKGDKQRTLPITVTTRNAIANYVNRYRPPYDDLPWLFISRTSGRLGPLGVRALELMLNKLGDKAGVEGVRCSPHTFRHTFALEYLNNGGDLMNLQAMLGHERMETVKIYVKLAGLNLAAQHRVASPVENWKLR